MAKRCNVRSFRYSNQVAQILRDYGSPYTSTNRKFELLILEAWATLPELRKQIKAHQQELEQLQARCRSWQARYDGLQLTAAQVQEIGVLLSQLQRKLETIVYDRSF